MRDDAKSFDEALGEAQRLGYAEANPTADVGGFDTARKTVILAAIASGKLVSTEDISIEGITEITLCDVELAQKLGYEIKLIGHSEIKDGKILAFVAPMAVSVANPLGRIDGVFNGILVNANMVGDVMFYGPGAGKLPTASAVVADIVDVIAKREFAPVALGWIAADKSDLADASTYSARRMVVSTKALGEGAENNGTFAYISDAMTDAEAAQLKANNAAITAVYKVL